MWVGLTVRSLSKLGIFGGRDWERWHHGVKKCSMRSSLVKTIEIGEILIAPCNIAPLQFCSCCFVESGWRQEQRVSGSGQHDMSNFSQMYNIKDRINYRVKLPALRRDLKFSHSYTWSSGRFKGWGLWYHLLSLNSPPPQESHLNLQKSPKPELTSLWGMQKFLSSVSVTPLTWYLIQPPVVVATRMEGSRVASSPEENGSFGVWILWNCLLLTSSPAHTPPFQNLQVIFQPRTDCPRRKSRFGTMRAPGLCQIGLWPPGSCWAFLGSLRWRSDVVLKLS